jgi:hypothetical protein
MFHAEYSTGQPLKMLTDLRTVIDEALSRTKPGGAKNPAKPVSQPPAPSRVVVPGPKALDSTAPEFDVSAPQHPAHED